MDDLNAHPPTDLEKLDDLITRVLKGEPFDLAATQTFGPGYAFGEACMRDVTIYNRYLEARAVTSEPAPYEPPAYTDGS